MRGTKKGKRKASKGIWHEATLFGEKEDELRLGEQGGTWAVW